MSNKETFDFSKKAQSAMGWRYHLNTMKALAAEKNIYIRVDGLDFRPISIDRANPCGRLYDQAGREIKGVKTIEEAIALANQSSADLHEPGVDKKEHRLQAGLIHHALNNDLKLDERLDVTLKTFFDELLFVGDEVRINAEGNPRVDILALGVKADVCFPVFIELKAKRDMERLVEQLRKAVTEAEKEQQSFVEMLAHTTGKPAQDINFYQYKLLMIWPSAKGKPKADLATKVLSDDPTKGHYIMAKYEVDENEPENSFTAIIEHEQNDIT